MTEFLFVLIAIIIPLIFSSLLSAAETAITAMSTAQLHKLKNDGNKRAIILHKLRKNKESLISTILLSNNICNIFASTMTTALLISIFGDEGVIYATLIMTIIIIIFAEVLPKTYAIANPESLALRFAYFLKIISIVFLPLTKILNKVIQLSNRFLNITHPTEKLVSATEEIKGTIDLHHSQGSMDQSDKYMLDGIFYLGETKVGQVITHRKNMQTINIDLDIKEILSSVKEIRHSRIPIWKESSDNIIGILNTRELLYRILEGQDLNSIIINDLISKPKFIHENTPLDEQLSEFKTSKSHFALVIDEYGDIQGLITLSDILEEVIGYMQDEFDNEKEAIIWQNNHCIIKGDVAVRDLNRALNWNLPEETNTIAGLLIHEAERIPNNEEILYFHGFVFTILAKKFNQLTRIKIEKDI